jgi:polyisoprenoid-binding protein YceI
MSSARTSVVGIAGILLAGPALGVPRTIDVAQSTLTVHVGKSGVFSAFGDTHEVRAPIASGAIDDGPKPSVELTVDARKMTVLDPGVAPDKRAEIQKRMLGPEVLDAERHPVIRFRSKSVKPAGEGRWRVEGELEIRGKTAPVAFDVTAGDGRVRGVAPVSQRAFGIEPISVAGGSVKVKDEVRVDFDVVLESPKP